MLHYTGIWTDSLRGGKTQLINTNKLLKRYNGVTGLKTGTTGGAGVCVQRQRQPGRAGISTAVVLGADSSKERFESAAALLDYGFSHYQAAPIPVFGQRPLQLPVRGSGESTIPWTIQRCPSGC